MTTVPSRIVFFVFASFIVTLFAGGMIIPVFVLSCLYIYWKTRIQIDLKLLFRPEFLSLFALLVWASASYFWSIAAANSMETIIKFWIISIFGITAIACLAQGYTDSIKPINQNLFFSLLILISIILTLEHISGYKLALLLRRMFNFEIYNYGQPMDHATALYSLLLPFCLYSFRNRKNYFYALLLLSAVVYFFHPMFAASLAVCLAILTALFFKKTGYPGLKFLAVTSILMIIFMPQVMAVILNMEFFQFIQSLPSSWQERIHIWNKSIELLNERQIFGWGLDSSSVIESSQSGESPGIIKVHPHNIPLQLHLESGLIGAILFSSFIYFVWRRIQQQKNLTFCMACVASITIYFCFAVFSFNAWHSWWLCAQYLAVISIMSFLKLGLHEDSMIA